MFHLHQITGNPPEVAAGGRLGSEPWVDLEQVHAVVWIVTAHSPSSTSTCVCCHGGSAISDTHPEPGGVASACRTSTASVSPHST